MVLAAQAQGIHSLRSWRMGSTCIPPAFWSRTRWHSPLWCRRSSGIEKTPTLTISRARCGSSRCKQETPPFHSMEKFGMYLDIGVWQDHSRCNPHESMRSRWRWRFAFPMQAEIFLNSCFEVSTVSLTGSHIHRNDNKMQILVNCDELVKNVLFY